MLRLAPPGFLRFSQASAFEAVFGGAESNAAVSLANFGIPVDFVTRLPANDLGDCVLMDLRKHGVGTQKIIRGGERLGIYFLEMGAVSRGSKVVYDRAHSSMATIQPGMIDWEAVFQDAGWFHWSGITPAISQSAADVCAAAIKAANQLGITVSTDLNYRKNLWQYGKEPSEVMPALVAGCDIVLGGKEEAEIYFGIHPDTNSEEESQETETCLSVCQQITSLFPKVKVVAMTLRKSVSASHNSWYGLLFDGKKIYHSRKYEITHMVDRVGGGDSFMGGLIYGMLTYGQDYQSTLDFAIAASCLKHTIYGDVNLVTVAEVDKLRSGDGSGRVSR